VGANGTSTEEGALKSLRLLGMLRAAKRVKKKFYWWSWERESEVSDRTITLTERRDGKSGKPQYWKKKRSTYAGGMKGERWG